MQQLFGNNCNQSIFYNVHIHIYTRKYIRQFNCLSIGNKFILKYAYVLEINGNTKEKSTKMEKEAYPSEPVGVYLLHALQNRLCCECKKLNLQFRGKGVFDSLLWCTSKVLPCTCMYMYIRTQLVRLFNILGRHGQ